MKKSKKRILKKRSPNKYSPRKYNWVLLKREFFLSDYLNVTDFLKAKKIMKENEIIGGHKGQATRRWTDSKVQYLTERREQILKLTNERNAEQYSKALNNIGNIIVSKVNMKIDPEVPKHIKQLTIKEITYLFALLRTLNNLPYKIIKTDNVQRLTEQTEEPVGKVKKDLLKLIQKKTIFNNMK